MKYFALILAGDFPFVYSPVHLVAHLAAPDGVEKLHSKLEFAAYQQARSDRSS